jgi:hypothetical protein
VTKGKIIAKVVKQSGGTQFHPEMYGDRESGAFKQQKNLPFKRRSDIIDTTP